jgi:hypothetical protein
VRVLSDDLPAQIVENVFGKRAKLVRLARRLLQVRLLVAVRVGFGTLPRIDSAQLIDSIMRSIRPILWMHGFIVQKHVQAAIFGG